MVAIAVVVMLVMLVTFGFVIGSAHHRHYHMMGILALMLMLTVMMVGMTEASLRIRCAQRGLVICRGLFHWLYLSGKRIL